MNDEALAREVFGNIPPASKIAFYLLAAAAVSVFGFGLYRRARLWKLGRRTAARIAWPRAAAAFLRDVVLQGRLPGRGLASGAHLLLFSGFLVLLAATVLIAVEHLAASALGRPPSRPVFHKGFYYAVYEAVTDLFGLALMVGCLLFALRRARRPPSVAHVPADWAVLAGLFVIGASGYVVEALRIHHTQPAGAEFSFIGSLLAGLIDTAGISIETAGAWHLGVWWLHALLALGLVAAMPYTRLLHALAGTLNVTAGRHALGTLPLVTPEEFESRGQIGAGAIADFTRRQLLELDACVACGRCQDACPAFEAGKPLSPRDVVQDLRRHLDLAGPVHLAQRGQERDRSASPKEVEPLHGGVIRAETLWSCTTCSACVDVCPLDVDPLGLITEMRRHLIAEGALHGPPAATLSKLQRTGNPWGLPAADRRRWSENLEVPVAEPGGDFDVLYWVGCAALFDKRTQNVARSVARLLKASGVKFAVLGVKERCTGEFARRMGDEFLFQELASANVAALDEVGAGESGKTIVTHCPHCLNSFKNDYPQVGGRYHTLHHSEFLGRLARAGRIPLVAERTGQRVTYHDPCYLARAAGCTRPPRSLLATGAAQGILEMPRHGRATACCGAGGGRMWFDDSPAERIGRSRVAEALATGAATVAVGCPFCLTMLADGVAASGGGAAVKDIAEILADRLPGP